MKARLVIAAVAGFLVAVLVLAQIERVGDDPTAVAAFERRMEDAFRPVNLRVPPAGVTAAIHTYLVEIDDGRVFEVGMDRAPTEAEVQVILESIAASGGRSGLPANINGELGKVVQIAPAWSHIEPFWATLVWSNRQIAEARAMSRYSSKPAGCSAYRWDLRTARAAEPWHSETHGRLLARRVGYSLGGAIAGFLATFIALAALVWSWRFLLARIRELALAVRGR